MEERTLPTPKAPSLRDRLGEKLRGRPGAALEMLIVLGLVALKLIPIKNPSLALLMLLFGWLSLWLRRVGWRGVGLRAPASWPRTVLLALAIAAVYDGIDIVGITPLLRQLTGEPLHIEALSASLRSNWPMLLLLLGVVWTFAAFGEEMVWRGYVLNRATDLFGGGRAAQAIAFVLVCALFGVIHWGQGITGVLDNVIASALFTTLYLRSGRNLWLPILTHGLIDTISLIVLACGYVPR